MYQTLLSELLYSKPNEPWTIVEIELESKKIDIDVIREPEDDSMMIITHW